MKALLKRDIPKRAAAVVLALALLAGVVTGREEPQVPPVAAPAASVDGRRATQARESSITVAAIDLDLDKLARPIRQGTVNDLFGRNAVAPPPPMQLSAPPPAPVVSVPTIPPPPPKPTAPALPFQYIGRMVDGESAVVFLNRGNEPVSIAMGGTLDNTYRLDQLSETTVVLTYLPLGERQTLRIPPAR